jgi:hypothetical protein
MLSFKSFLISEEAGSDEAKSNTALGDAFETATVLHIHNNTGAKHNTSPEYVKTIEAVRKKHAAAVSSLSPDKASKAIEGGRQAGAAYIDSLKNNHKMNPADVHEVHHTSLGIDKHIGKTVDRASNPHDLIVKGKNGFIHGSSLKLTKGTASNNSAAAFDEKAGLKTNIAKVWADGKKKAGLSGMKNKDIKQIKKNPEIVRANRETQQAAANHHAEVFNAADHATKVKHLGYLLKGRPDSPMDYTVAGKNSSSTPIHKVPHIEALHKAKSIKATVANNRVNFHDEKGNHIAYVEHRPTHGSFISVQANAKFGNMKK